MSTPGPQKYSRTSLKRRNKKERTNENTFQWVKKQKVAQRRQVKDYTVQSEVVDDFDSEMDEAIAIVGSISSLSRVQSTFLPEKRRLDT